MESVLSDLKCVVAHGRVVTSFRQITEVKQLWAWLVLAELDE